MSKYARQEIEPVVTGSLLAAESQLDEARQAAYGPPQLSITDNTFWTGKPQTIEIDRDRDGKPDAIASIDYTIFGNLDTITVKNAATGQTEYTMSTSRFLGHAMKVTADLNGDGKEDIAISPRKWFLSKNVGRLDIDRNGDGKADANIDIDRTWWTRTMYALDYDRNNDGVVDQTFKIKRGSFSGYLSQIRPELTNR